jgi:hypothetical protein
MMKSFLLSLAISFTAFQSFAQANRTHSDTIKLLTDSSHAYYQKIFTLPAGINDSVAYTKILEFMAAKNIQQTYADDSGHKMIFSTSQDLNTNLVYIGDEADAVDPYTVQFAVIIDLRSHRYRFTVNNVVFYSPSPTGSRREPLYDMYLKATNKESKRVAKDAKKILDSFQRYLLAFTADLTKTIEQKSPAYNSVF